MPDLLLRFILFLGFVSIIFTWSATTPTPFFLFLRRLRSPSTFVSLIYEAVVALQFVQLVDIRLFPTGFDPLITIFGLGLFILGVVLAVWAKITMNQNWGPPGQHNLEKQKQLVTRGPFTRTRNPIYLGLLAVFCGFEIALESYFIILIVPLFLFIIRAITIEEKLLTGYFGKTYHDYLKKVPRFL